MANVTRLTVSSWVGVIFKRWNTWTQGMFCPRAFLMCMLSDVRQLLTTYWATNSVVKRASLTKERTYWHYTQRFPPDRKPLQCISRTMTDRCRSLRSLMCVMGPYNNFHYQLRVKTKRLAARKFRQSFSLRFFKLKGFSLPWLVGQIAAGKNKDSKYKD